MKSLDSPPAHSEILCQNGSYDDGNKRNRILVHQGESPNDTFNHVYPASGTALKYRLLYRHPILPTPTPRSELWNAEVSCTTWSAIYRAEIQIPKSPESLATLILFLAAAQLQI